jgi:hypothetical protein
MAVAWPLVARCATRPCAEGRRGPQVRVAVVLIAHKVEDALLDYGDAARAVVLLFLVRLLLVVAVLLLVIVVIVLIVVIVIVAVVLVLIARLIAIVLIFLLLVLLVRNARAA